MWSLALERNWMVVNVLFIWKSTRQKRLMLFVPFASWKESSWKHQNAIQQITLLSQGKKTSGKICMTYNINSDTALVNVIPQRGICGALPPAGGDTQEQIAKSPCNERCQQRAHPDCWILQTARGIGQWEWWKQTSKTMAINSKIKRILFERWWTKTNFQNLYFNH